MGVEIDWDVFTILLIAFGLLFFSLGAWLGPEIDGTRDTLLAYGDAICEQTMGEGSEFTLEGSSKETVACNELVTTKEYDGLTVVVNNDG